MNEPGCDGKPEVSTLACTHRQSRLPRLELRHFFPANGAPRQSRHDGSHPPTRRETLSVEVARYLLDVIVTGHAEARLPTEPEMSDQLGVSRTVVREAIRLLLSKGVVTVRHGSGMRVNPILDWRLLDPDVVSATVRCGRDRAILSELIETRALLEVQITGLAARRRTVSDLARLDEILDAMVDSQDDADVYANLDNAFHEAVVDATGNRFLREAVRPVNEALNPARRLASANRAIVARSIESHAAIIEAIRTGNCQKASDAMARHLSEFDLDLRHQFGQGHNSSQFSSFAAPGRT